MVCFASKDNEEQPFDVCSVWLFSAWLFVIRILPQLHSPLHV